MKLVILIYYSVVIIYLIMSTIFYWINDLKFSLCLNKLRKTFYLSAILGAVLCILNGYISTDDWKKLIYYTVAMVVVDIAVFETPSISKFANAEFKSNEIMSKITSENERTFDIIENKQKVFLSIIQEAECYFEQQNVGSIKIFDEYKKELLEYLNEYTNIFQIKVYMYEVDYSNDTKLIKSIKEVLENIIIKNSLKIRKGIIDRISKNISMGQIQKLDSKIHLIPIFSGEYSYIILISGEDIIDTDIMNVLYMVNIFLIYRNSYFILKNNNINDKINI